MGTTGNRRERCTSSEAHAAPQAPPGREQNPLWRYSLRVYRLPGVEAACLSLQDGFGTDTNVLLYCCWLGAAGRSIDKRGLRATVAALARWQTEVIQPLRQARRALKSAPLALPDETLLDLRKRLGAIELDLEYLEQCRLLEQARSVPPARERKRDRSPSDAMHANVRRYLELMAIPAASDAWRQARKLIEACGAVPHGDEAPRPVSPPR